MLCDTESVVEQMTDCLRSASRS